MIEQLHARVGEGLFRLEACHNLETRNCHIENSIRRFVKRHRDIIYPMALRFHEVRDRDGLMMAERVEREIDERLPELGVGSLESKHIESGNIILVVWNSFGVGKFNGEIQPLVFGLGRIDKKPVVSFLQHINMAWAKPGECAIYIPREFKTYITPIAMDAPVVLSKV